MDVFNFAEELQKIQLIKYEDVLKIENEFNEAFANFKYWSAHNHYHYVWIDSMNEEHRSLFLVLVELTGDDLDELSLIHR